MAVPRERLEWLWGEGSIPVGPRQLGSSRQEGRDGVPTAGAAPAGDDGRGAAVGAVGTARAPSPQFAGRSEGPRGVSRADGKGLRSPPCPSRAPGTPALPGPVPCRMAHPGAVPCPGHPATVSCSGHPPLPGHRPPPYGHHSPPPPGAPPGPTPCPVPGNTMGVGVGGGHDTTTTTTHTDAPPPGLTARPSPQSPFPSCQPPPAPRRCPPTASGLPPAAVAAPPAGRHGNNSRSTRRHLCSSHPTPRPR